MSAFLFYCLVILDSFKHFLSATSIALIFPSIIVIVITVFVSLMLCSTESNVCFMDIIKKYKKLITYPMMVLTLGGILSFTNALLPTTKQMAVIYFIPMIVNNEQIQNISKNSLSILEAYSKQYIDDLTKKIVEEPKKGSSVTIEPKKNI